MEGKMSSLERFEAALKLSEPDMVPASLFGGIVSTRFVDGLTVPEFGEDGLKMGKATKAMYEEIGGDALYLLSDMGIIVSGWGVKMQQPTEPLVHLMLGEFAVKAPEDWEKLHPLDPRKDGRMHIYLNGSKFLRETYGDKVPIGVSLPSPLTTATHVCSMDDVMVHALTEPALLKKAIKEAIAPTVADFINACVDSGAYFTGYLTTRATKELFTEAQYREFGMPYDIQVFSKTPGAMHMPHICGLEPMFDIICEYKGNFPNVSSISWWDRGAKPNLKEAKEKYGKKLCLAAGVDHATTLITGTPNDVAKQVKDALEIAKPGGGFILAPGCEVSPKTPMENMKAFVKAAREYGKY